MNDKFFFEVLDKSLKDIMSENMVVSKKIFWGNVVAFCAYFRQILLVIPKDSRYDIVLVTMNASYI